MAGSKAESEPNSASKFSGGALANRGFGAYISRHFKKWWWIYLIAFTITMLAVVLSMYDASNIPA
jgi:hypothetical protein